MVQRTPKTITNTMARRGYSLWRQAPLFIVLLLAGSASVAIPQTRQHDAHVHGIGMLNIAVAGDELVIELHSPAANIVGFEHAPAHEEQQHAISEATALLEQGEKLFSLPAAAQCTLTDVQVENDMTHGQGEDDTHHRHEDEQAHSEFEATYHFDCARAGKLTTIDVQLFSHFPGFEALEVQLLTPTRQTAAALNAQQRRIALD